MKIFSIHDFILIITGQNKFPKSDTISFHFISLFIILSHKFVVQTEIDIIILLSQILNRVKDVTKRKCHNASKTRKKTSSSTI